jgi:hypothetical protein
LTHVLKIFILSEGTRGTIVSAEVEGPAFAFALAVARFL